MKKLARRLACLGLVGASAAEVSNDFFPFVPGDIESSEIASPEPGDDSDTNNNILVTSDSDCPLDCQNGSVCVPGNQSVQGHPVSSSITRGVALSFHKELNRKGWHCECPNGFTGLDCETAFHSCTDGDHVCYHGGVCITGDPDASDFYGTGESHCDCASAMDTENNWIKYIGAYCEEPIVDTEYCVQEGLCRNGGTCQDDATEPCQCTSGYFGVFCEFVKESAQDCPMACTNGGVCRVASDNQYCVCPDSFEGNLCEIPKREPCGDTFCENGGKCFEITLSTGQKEHLCDCAPGYTDEVYYSGEFCQYPSTSFCSGQDDPNGRQFCTNGGECPLEAHEACTCPPGFSGPRCAYQSGVDGQDYAECQLGCMNGGTCHKGTKDISAVYGKFADGVADMLDTTHSNFEHCVCPENFYGIRCEYEVDECTNNGHVCLHGSTCRDFAGQSSCNCEDSNHQTAGLYCEFFATEVCDGTIEPGPEHRGFCTNGGSCVVNNSTMGCRCPEGYEGPHCEFVEEQADSIPTLQAPGQEPRRSGFLSGSSWLLVTAVLFFGLGAVVWFMVIYPRSSSMVGEPNGVWSKNNLAAGEAADSKDRSRPVEQQSGLSDVDII